MTEWQVVQSVALASLLAWAIVRYEFPGRRIVDAIVAIDSLYRANDLVATMAQRRAHLHPGGRDVVLLLVARDQVTEETELLRGERVGDRVGELRDPRLVDVLDGGQPHLGQRLPGGLLDRAQQVAARHQIRDREFAAIVRRADHRNRAAPGEKKTEYPASEPDEARRDEHEANGLFVLLEHEVVPLFYDRAAPEAAPRSNVSLDVVDYDGARG